MDQQIVKKRPPKRLARKRNGARRLGEAEKILRSVQAAAAAMLAAYRILRPYAKKINAKRKKAKAKKSS